MFDSLKQDKTCDFLIIGGGFAGLLTAFYLNKRGFDVILAEKNLIGNGRTSMESGILSHDCGFSVNYLQHIFPETFKEELELNKRSVNRLLRISKEIKLTSLSSKDFFFFSDKTEHSDILRREYMLRKYCGDKVFLLSGSDCADKFSFDVHSGVYVENGVFVTNPKTFSQYIASFLSLNGATISEYTEIVSIIQNNNMFVAKTDSNIEIKAKIILDTHASPQSQKKPTQIIVSEPINNFTGWHNGCVICDAYKNKMKFYLDFQNRINMRRESSHYVNIFKKDVLNFGDIHRKYMETVMKSMFFAIPKIKICEKYSYLKESSPNGHANIELILQNSCQNQNIKSKNKKISGSFFSFSTPYAGGSISAERAARIFAKSDFEL